jgi:hypothetical protein
MASSELKNSKILNDDLIRVYNLIEGAKLVVNLDSKKATKYYDLANSIVQSYLNKICKNC